MNNDRFKVIRHNVNRINEPDDFSYPIRVEIFLRPPELCLVAFALTFGCEEISIIYKDTITAAEHIGKNELNSNPRLAFTEVTLRDSKGKVIGRKAIKGQWKETGPIVQDNPNEIRVS